MIGKGITYPTLAGFDCYGNPFKEDSEGEVGGCGQGVYRERGVCTNRNQGEVFVDEVSRKGKCEGVLEGFEVEERGIGAGQSKDQQRRVSFNHHFFITQPTSQFHLITNVLGAPTYLKTNRRQYIDDNVIARSQATDPMKSKM